MNEPFLRPSNNLKLLEHNFTHKHRKVLFWVRFGFVFGTVLFTLVNSVFGLLIPSDSVPCVKDYLLDWTEELNTYFRENEPERHTLLIVSSLLVDVLLLHFLVKYLIWGDSWQEPFFIVSFFAFRYCIQQLFHLKYPEGFIWDYPGFPSFAIPYFESSDFFFSGHVGIVSFCALFNYKTKSKLMTVLSVLAVALEFFAMMVLRTHYTIDLVCGILFAHYFWILSGQVSAYVDAKTGYKKTYNRNF